MESSRVLGNSAELSKTFLLLPILILAQLNLGKMQFLLLSRSQSKTYVQSLKSSSWVLGAFSTISIYYFGGFFSLFTFFQLSFNWFNWTDSCWAKNKTKRKNRENISFFLLLRTKPIGVKALTIFVPSDFVYWKAAIWAMEPLMEAPSQQPPRWGHFPNEWTAINIDSHRRFRFAKNIFRRAGIQPRGRWGHTLK